jgi:hypothetical protein
MTSTLPRGVETSETDDLNPRTVHEPRARRLQRVWSARRWGADTLRADEHAATRCLSTARINHPPKRPGISAAANPIRTEAPSRGSRASEDRRFTASAQWVTLTLDGITAADYLSWVRDPEPLALGRDLRRLAARAEPLGDRIELELIWDREPPAPRSAVLAAGFPPIPEVVGIGDELRGESRETSSVQTIRPRRATENTPTQSTQKKRAVSPHIYRLLMNKKRAEQRRRINKRQHLHKLNR